MRKSGLLILIFILNSVISYGQYKFESVFRGFSGQDLLNKVVGKYKPQKVKDYSEARDILYGKIYNKNDTVYGVYTRFGVYLPKGVDPSTFVFNKGINAEHTFPRSKGAKDGNAKSDMHHLYPSKINVNSDRGSLPFKDINDSQTNDWYYDNTILHSKPSKNIDAYSEHINTYFEPREDHKGNVARAMMYFYTMYKSEADAKDPSFFNKQKETLCKWHFLDPVDSLEWERTWQIAKYQSNKPNPFVLDCSLASRTYCDFISDACQSVGVNDVFNEKSIGLRLYPNPTKNRININFVNPGLAQVKVNVINILGELKYSKIIDLKTNEISEFDLLLGDLKSGLYILSLNGIDKNNSLLANKMFVIE